jgi:hypothetical protein
LGAHNNLELVSDVLEPRSRRTKLGAIQFVVNRENHCQSY